MPGKTHSAAAVLADEPARLAELLKTRIDAFASRPADESKLGSEARDIGIFARTGALILGLETAQARACRQPMAGRPTGHDDFEPDEGDVMETDERSAGRDDPEHMERLRADLATRFSELNARLESQGLLDRVLAIDCPPSGADLVLRPQPQPATA